MTSSRQIVITLLVVALVCSVILSYVYSYTGPRIEETQKALMLAGLREVIDAQEFSLVIPDTVWRAVDADGEVIGVVFRVFPQGYGGVIPITVGLDLDGKITGVRIASAAEGLGETPGLGAKIVEKWFTDQFIGKCMTAVQLKRDGGEIDAITAATISSRAVCNGIQKGMQRYVEMMEASVDKRCVFPSATDFVDIIKDTLWYAVADKETLGIVFVGWVDGYADRIEFVVGASRKGTITGIEVLYSNETPDIGERIREPDFLDKFKEGIPDAISGATISSKALITAIQELVARYREHLK